MINRGDTRIDPIRRFKGYSSWANSQIHKFFHESRQFRRQLVSCVENCDTAAEAAECLFWTLLGMMNENGEIMVDDEKVVNAMEMEYVRYPEIVSLVWRHA